MREEESRGGSAHPDGRGTSPAAEVLAALRSVPKVDGPLSDDLATRPFDLADALFDRAASFAFDRLVHLATLALIDELDTLASELLLQERLLLDPRAIAEETVLRLVVEALEGRRARPLKAWARRCVRNATDAAREDGSLAPLHGVSEPASARAVTAAAAVVVNGLDAPMRELAWLAWVELLTPEQIRRRTGRPLEDVERDLIFILERARAAIEASPRTRDARRTAPRERTHADEREEGGAP